MLTMLTNVIVCKTFVSQSLSLQQNKSNMAGERTNVKEVTDNRTTGGGKGTPIRKKSIGDTELNGVCVSVAYTTLLMLLDGVNSCCGLLSLFVPMVSNDTASIFLSVSFTSLLRR